MPSGLTTRMYSLVTAGRPAVIWSRMASMASRMSPGSNPAMAPGTPKSRAMNPKGSSPIMALTWPGYRNPCTRTSSAWSRAFRGGGTSQNAVSTEKLRSSSAAAVLTVRAIAGIVVSKPTPKNTTSLSGDLRAISRASAGEYTTLTREFSAGITVCREPWAVGTLVMSPKVVSTKLFRSVTRRMAASWNSLGVMHTGQPGPVSISMPASSSIFLSP